VLTVDLDRLQVGPGDDLLDLGCGAGRHAFAAVRRGARVIALDADEQELEGVATMVAAMHEVGEVPAGGSVRTVHANALSLPFDDGAFDRIIAAEVLEHIPDDELAIAELARVLRPGGRIAVTVPSRFPERINWLLSDDYHDFPGGHIRIYSRAELTGKLTGAGMRVLGSHRAHALHSPYWWIRCAGGVNRPERAVARRYHDVLVKQIMENPPYLGRLDAVLNPVLGKSLIVYAVKP
jgi:SAM-dependent methyltransferase